MKKYELTKKLLSLLEKRLNLSINLKGVYEDDRHLLRGICNQLPPMDLGKDFYDLQDELLSIERDEKGTINVNDLKFNDSIALFKGDITTLKADAIVNAANSEYLGCFVPCHSCIDNIIMSASGFQMRNELYNLKKQSGYEHEKVKVTGGYNLPCKFVFHVAGPQIFGEVTEKDEMDLSNCYINALNKAKELGLKSIVFCCISTGLYAFPNELASKVAIHAVKDWLKNSDYKIKVVFDVFKEIDEELYNEQLQ